MILVRLQLRRYAKAQDSRIEAETIDGDVDRNCISSIEVNLNNLSCAFEI